MGNCMNPKSRNLAKLHKVAKLQIEVKQEKMTLQNLETRFEMIEKCFDLEDRYEFEKQIKFLHFILDSVESLLLEMTKHVGKFEKSQGTRRLET